MRRLRRSPIKPGERRQPLARAGGILPPRPLAYILRVYPRAPAHRSHRGSFAMTNADPHELQKFSDLAHRWWDPNAEFKPLHELNPVRLNWIDAHAHLAGKHVLDIGCGGGILSESMAGLGAHVKGIDLSSEALGVADLHSLESGVTVNYEEIAAE